MNMSLLKPQLIFSLKRNLSTTMVRSAAWNKDWKPGKFPKTEEERLAAAKKYNLLPEEYKPHPDDGQGCGDYPDIKPTGVESRDPFYPWDYPEYRRNYGEVIHYTEQIYGEDRYNINMRPRYSIPVQLACFIGTMSACWMLFRSMENTNFQPAAKQHMPKPGVKNYTY